MPGLRPSAVALAVVVALAAAAVAEARPRPRRAARFQANKTFGLGVMIGAPTGLSGKFFLGPDTALDFGLGWNREFRYHRGVAAHMDFLWHPVTLAQTQPFYLPLYVGLGGRVLQHDRYKDDYDDHTHLGLRGPIGIALDFNNIPLDIFFELALVFDVVVDSDDHSYVDLDGALGVRFWF
jgi:hypothetical protein